MLQRRRLAVRHRPGAALAVSGRTGPGSNRPVSAQDGLSGAGWSNAALRPRASWIALRLQFIFVVFREFSG